jgi:SAM-dependent methyltransferase/DNA-binding transcriptional ArsR family regulator
VPAPDDLKPFRRHAEWAVVASTARELGLYDALADGPATPGDLAEERDLDARGVEIVLGVLEEMGLVRVEPEGAYRLTGPARGFLVDRDTPDYMGEAVDLWLRNIREWTASLPGSVASGAPPEDALHGDEEMSDREAMESFQAAMANKNPRLVDAVVDAVVERASGPGRVLDVGGGPGTFARAFVERGWEGVLQDRPEVVDHVAEAYGLADVEGLALVGGDFLEALPDGPFDVVFLANITHLWEAGTNRELLARCADRLAPGGVLAVMDFVRGVEPFAALFAVTMLLNTERGNTYSLHRYEEWLEGAGLRGVRCRSVTENRQVVTALRPRTEHVTRRARVE